MKSAFYFLLIIISFPAEAYLGPGLGAGIIATVVGVLGAVVLAIIGLVYYPLKRFLRNRKVNKIEDDNIEP